MTFSCIFGLEAQLDFFNLKLLIAVNFFKDIFLEYFGGFFFFFLTF
jgi:hypothetical protein